MKQPLEERLQLVAEWLKLSMILGKTIQRDSTTQRLYEQGRRKTVLYNIDPSAPGGYWVEGPALPYSYRYHTDGMSLEGMRDTNPALYEKVREKIVKQLTERHITPQEAA